MMKCKQSENFNLRTADEQSDAYQQFARHVEVCKECSTVCCKSRNSRILGGKKPRVRGFPKTCLACQPGIDTQSVWIEFADTQREKDQENTPSQLAAFLDAPSHPELLGRIGRYDVERVVGEGGMGIVLKGYDSELHRVVAIKMLAPDLAGKTSARQRFAREARAAAAVVHPHVIPIHDVESEGTLPYLVMQFVSGQSLQSRIETEGLMSVVDALRVAQQTASGLTAAHAQGLVHRDVKPANILLEENVERALLSDFGLARAADDAS